VKGQRTPKDEMDARKRPAPQPAEDDGDIEILEVVGVEENAAGPDSPEGAAGAEEASEAEYVLDFDDPEPGGVLPGPDVRHLTGARTSEGDAELLLRLRADYDNLRKRFVREREDLERKASSSLVQRLLPILDNLERALAVQPAVAAEDSLREGLAIIHRQLIEQLRQEGLQEIDAVARPFDPNLHEAVSTTSRSDCPPNVVVEELQKGYLFHGHVLRPAMVKVSTGRADGGDEPR
jgi:molecular chaperone GrpE (heat shock protein)